MTSTTASTITIHTDGACKGNPGPGAWGVVIDDENRRTCLAGYSIHATNQQMELTAAIEALEAVSQHRGRPIALVSDSSYLINGMTQWLDGWKARSWKNVKNRELWERLDTLRQGHEITWTWVRGHSGNPGNELADALANRAMTEGRISEVFEKSESRYRLSEAR